MSITIILITSLLVALGVIPTLKLNKRWNFYPKLLLFVFVLGLAILLSLTMT